MLDPKPSAAWVVLAMSLAFVALACGEDPPPADTDAGVATDATTTATPLTVTLAPPLLDGTAAHDTVEVALDGAEREVLVTDAADLERLVTIDARVTEGTATLTVAGWDPTDATDDAWFFAARRHRGALPTLRVSSSGRATVEVRITTRAVPPDAVVERSLVWTDPAIVDTPAIVGLARVMAAASDDGHGGALLDHLLRTFARTAHSERPRLLELADALRARFGDDPASWDLDALPFLVTAVHDRIDLRNADHCGELRVSFNVTDREFPFVHFLFLFAQGSDADVAFTGTRHCEESAFRWAFLATRAGAGFVEGARAILEQTITPASFLMVESLERTVGNWEWRQWRPEDNADPATMTALPRVLANPPLFQTVDIERLNAPGADRGAFLTWVASNADAVETRHAPIPPAFAPRSARAADGIPRTPLDLSGLTASLAPRTEALRGALDSVGCPGCHERSTTFVQTNPDRTFSRFYELELEARRDALDAFRDGTATQPPFGALQD